MKRLKFIHVTTATGLGTKYYNKSMITVESGAWGG